MPIGNFQLHLGVSGYEEEALVRASHPVVTPQCANWKHDLYQHPEHVFPLNRVRGCYASNQAAQCSSVLMSGHKKSSPSSSVTYSRMCSEDHFPLRARASARFLSVRASWWDLA